MKTKTRIALAGLASACVLLGAAVIGYQDWQLRGSAPGNPASGYLRMWADNTAGKFKCLTSGGAACYFDLPNPSSSTLGGIESLAAVSHNWINTISTSGVPSATRPACADLSDSAGSCSTNPVSSATTGQIAVYTGSATLGGQDDRDVKIIPAANAPGGTAGGGWSYASGQFTTVARAGTNNLGGTLQAIPSTGAVAQFDFELPKDWDTGTQPYIAIWYASGANTSGTVIWTVSSACSKADGSVSDDASFNAESAFGTQTMATANRTWAQTGQFTAMTSGNNCIAPSSVIIKLALSGTASSNINVQKAVMTVPTHPSVQAN